MQALLKRIVVWQQMDFRKTWKKTLLISFLLVKFANEPYLSKAPTSLLQPIPTSSSIWEHVAIDFLVNLPVHQGDTAIMVVIDHFSKAAHFEVLRTNFLDNKA